jgi:ribosome-binding factor A
MRIDSPPNMSKRKKSRRRRFDASCAETWGPDDGIDPSDEKRAEARPVRNRKALQLCRQVAEALALAFSGCADPVLNDLLIVAVRPAPDSSRLLVLVQSASGVPVTQSLLLEHLERAKGMLRQEVARSIHRRKTPDLTFAFVTG